MKKLLLFLTTLIIFLSFVSFAEAVVTITNPLTADTFEGLIEAISTAIAGLVGGIAVIMLIIAGIYFLTSAGDPIKLQTAKKFLIYAIIGIVIAIIAKVIVNVVLWILGAPLIP